MALNATQNRVSEDLDFFLTANLPLKLTGLSFLVWISPRGNAMYAVRVKVSPGPRAICDMTTVAMRPDIQVVEGQMKTQDLALLSEWIQLNRAGYSSTATLPTSGCAVFLLKRARNSRRLCAS